MNCNHPDCDCKDTPVERNGKSWCSEACATGVARASADTDAGCGCGHAGCGTQDVTQQGAGRSGAGRADHQGLSTHGGEGSSSFRASAPGESAGLRGDGLVGDADQRAAERPGRNQPDDARKLGFSAEDEAGAGMKPGAAQPRGSGDSNRSTVRRGGGGGGARSLQAPGTDRDI